MEIKGSTTFELTGCDPYYADGRHQLYIPPYIIPSPVFAIAGHYWMARFDSVELYRSADHYTVSLKLMPRSDVADGWVRASDLSVIDPSAILPPRLLSAAPMHNFASSDGGGDFDHFSGAGVDINKTALNDQCVGYVRNGRLQIQCTVTVFPEEPDHTPDPAGGFELPPSDMIAQLGEVFKTGEGADVTFSVEGELFPVHKIVLAMRSPVFEAELYGEMMENGAAQTIVIDDMRADTFKALLRYIYTDASLDIIDGDSNQGEGADGVEDKKVWELLTAADRYGVERLKLICERGLCKRLDIESVADTLALADQHHCYTLKDACIQFMTTSQRMTKGAATQGYKQLKGSHPSLVFEVLEKSRNFH